MKLQENEDYLNEVKNYINKEKKKQKEALQIANKIMDIDMLCIKELRKIKIIRG